MNDELKVSSVNLNKTLDFPTLLSPISSNLTKVSYSFSIIYPWQQNLVVNIYFRCRWLAALEIPILVEVAGSLDQAQSTNGNPGLALELWVTTGNIVVARYMNRSRSNQSMFVPWTVPRYRDDHFLLIAYVDDHFLFLIPCSTEHQGNEVGSVGRNETKILCHFLLLLSVQILSLSNTGVSLQRGSMALVSRASPFTREEGSGQLRIMSLCCRVSIGQEVQCETSNSMLLMFAVSRDVVLAGLFGARPYIVNC